MRAKKRLLALKDQSNTEETRITENAADADEQHISPEAEWQLAIADIVANSAEANLAYLDSNFNFVWVNSSYADKSGYTKEDLIGRNHFELFPNEENQQIFEMVRKTGQAYEAKEKPFVYESQLERGVTYWNWKLVPVRLEDDPAGTTRGYAFTLVDVTEDVRIRQEMEKLRTEAEMRAAELEAVMSGMADGVSFIDMQGNVAWMNQAGRHILKVPEYEPFAKWVSRFKRFNIEGDSLPFDETAVARAMLGEVVKDSQYKFITPWGFEIVLEISASPVTDSQGKIIGVVNIFRDVTKKVEFEKQQEEVLMRERKIADTLQQALIPPEVNYNISGCKVAVKYQPALLEAKIGGDFYDVFELSDGKIGILIGDVAGKGLPAAIRVAAVRYAIRSYAYLDSGPGKTLTLANEALSKESDNGHGMLTAIFAVLDAKAGTVTYAIGGHEPPFIRRTEGDLDEPELLGRALGVWAGYDYSEEIINLKYGDVVIMVTDGITEARPSTDKLYGREGIRHYLSENPDISLEQIPDGLLEAAKSHAGGNLQDDAAIVAFKFEDSGA